MAAKKPAPKPKPAPYKGAAASPAPPKKITTEFPGTSINPLEPKDVAYNKAIDDYTKHRNAAIAAEKKYGKDHPAYVGAVKKATAFYESNFRNAYTKDYGKALAAHQAATGKKLTAQEELHYRRAYNQHQQTVSLRQQEQTEKVHLKGAAEAKEQAARGLKFEEAREQAGTTYFKQVHIAPKPPAHFTENVPVLPPVHLYDRLANPKLKSAYLALKTEFDKFGLSTLAPKIFNYIQNGFNSDTISLMLQQSPEYQNRFSGNAIREKAGLRILSPAEYLSVEQSYRQLMSQSGLPGGFYDKPSDFAAWIGKDVSPQEAKERIDMAKNATAAASPEVKQALKTYYGLDDAHVTAHFLDSKAAEPVLQNQIAAAQVGAAAKESGLDVTGKSIAEEAALRGVSYQQAQQAYSNISGFLGHAMELAHIYGQQYNQQTAEQEALLGQGAAKVAREKLSKTAEADFGATGGVAQGALGSVVQNR